MKGEECCKSKKMQSRNPKQNLLRIVLLSDDDLNEDKEEEKKQDETETPRGTETPTEEEAGTSYA